MDTPPEDAQRRIVHHASRMRVLGLWLGLLPVGVTLRELQAPGIVWLLAAAHVLVWPWVAHRLARLHASPVAMERRNLIVDAVMGGLWVAVMQFALVPSAVLASIMLMDKFAFGGPRLALRCAVAFLASAVVVAALNGFAFSPSNTMAGTIASLPLLLVYPSAVAFAAHRLAHEVRRQRAALDAMRRTDPLTGLANPQALMDAADHEFRRFRRSGHRATVMLIDVDRFRLLNDVHGARAADAALQAVAAVLKRTLRDTDACGRLHGDRFGAVLTDASGSGVGELAERLRQAIGSLALDELHGAHLTASVGFAQIDSGMRSRTQWFAAAEAALDAAKSAGRNRSMSAPAMGTAP